MTAPEAVKKELDKVLRAQASCVNEHGMVKTSMRYRYDLLTAQACEFRKCLDWFEGGRG